MKYTEKQLFEFMDAKKPVKVTSVDGDVFTGMCWAYSSVTNDSEFGVSAPSIEIEDTVLYTHEIKTIEFAQ